MASREAQGNEGRRVEELRGLEKERVKGIGERKWPEFGEIGKDSEEK